MAELPTIRVKIKETNQTAVINEVDFDPDLHTLIEEKKEKPFEEGAVSGELIKIFEDKVKEHKRSSLILLSLSISIMGLVVVVLFLSAIIALEEYSGLRFTFVKQTFLMFSIPILGLISWFLLFLFNRRKESKKLEEIYSHKEVMARAFVGYRKILKESPNDQENEDSLRGLEDALLEAIKKDPSDAIKSRSDHPISLLKLDKILKSFTNKDSIGFPLWKDLISPANKDNIVTILQTLIKLLNGRSQREEKRDNKEKAKK